MEIEATYLVTAGAPIQSVDQVDKDGMRIAASGRSAYDLYLTRSLDHAELHRPTRAAATFDTFPVGHCDAPSGPPPAPPGPEDAAGPGGGCAGEPVLCTAASPAVCCTRRSQTESQ